MKKILFFIAVVFVAGSCKLLDKFTEIDIDSEIKLGYKVEMDEEDNTFDEKDVFSLEDDKDLEEYLDNLEEIVVDSIKVSISEYSGPDTCTITGTLSYSKEDGSDLTAFYSFTDFDVKGYYTSEDLFKLVYDEATVQAMAKLMLEEQSIALYLQGSSNDVPVTFKLNVIVYTNTTVQALD